MCLKLHTVHTYMPLMQRIMHASKVDLCYLKANWPSDLEVPWGAPVSGVKEVLSIAHLVYIIRF